MTLSTVIKDTRTAVANDPAAAQVLFSADGTLTGVTEVDMRTGSHAFTVDEAAKLGGGATTRWPGSGPARPSHTVTGPSVWEFPSARSPCGWRETSTSAAFSG